MTEDKRERADWKQANGTKQKKEKKKRKKKQNREGKGNRNKILEGEAEIAEIIYVISTPVVRRDQDGGHCSESRVQRFSFFQSFSRHFVLLRLAIFHFVTLLFWGTEHSTIESFSFSIGNTRGERAGKMRRGMNFSQRINSSSLKIQIQIFIKSFPSFIDTSVS